MTPIPALFPTEHALPGREPTIDDKTLSGAITGRIGDEIDDNTRQFLPVRHAPQGGSATIGPHKAFAMVVVNSARDNTIDPDSVLTPPCG